MDLPEGYSEKGGDSKGNPARIPASEGNPYLIFISLKLGISLKGRAFRKK